METLEDILGKHDLPPYLTPAEVGKILKIHPSTVRRQCEQGEYKRAFKVGGITGPWRIPTRFFERKLLLSEEHGEFIGS